MATAGAHLRPPDENLRRIRKLGRKKWKCECGDHARVVVYLRSIPKENYHVQAESAQWMPATTTKRAIIRQ